MATGRMFLGGDSIPVSGVNVYHARNDAYRYNGALDSADAIQAALDLGQSVQLPQGHYRISKPLKMRTGRFSGQGARTTCLYMDDVSAPAILCEEGTADGCSISDISLTTFMPMSNQHGILMRSAFSTVERVGIHTFGGHGIQVGEGPANSQMWGLAFVDIGSCGGNGLHLHYGNAGLAIRVSVLGGQGMGVCDESNLGNTYVGCHVEAVVGACYKGGGDPAIPAIGVQRTSFLGCYAEGPMCLLYPPAVWVGGYPVGGFNQEAIDGGCLGFLDANTVYPFKMGSGAGVNRVEYLLGAHGQPSTAFGWRVNAPYPNWDAYRMRWRSDLNAMLLTRDGPGGSADVAWGHTTFGHKRGWSHSVLPQSLIGAGEVRVTSGPTAPSSGLWECGDRHFHSDPGPGEPTEWVAVVRGGWPSTTRTNGARYGRYAAISPIAGHVWECVVDSGNVAGSAPVFTAGQNVVDGEVTWRYAGVVPPVFVEK